MNNYNLTKKAALITRASGLLGVEHAIALLDLGASVVITDVNEKNLVRTNNSLSNEDNKYS